MYRLYQFGSKVLPDARSEFDGATPAAWNPVIALPGGSTALDTLSTAQAGLRVPYEIKYSSIVSGASLSALETTLAAWRAQVGTREALYRRALGSAVNQWLYARLQRLEIDTRPRNSLGRWQMVEWTFLALEEFWRHATTTKTDATLDTNPKTFDVVNAGNAIVRDCVFTVTAGSADITALTFNMLSGTYNWNYNGTIAAGSSVVVDAGARTVRTGLGVNVYSNFVLNSGHVFEDWIGIPTGTRTVVIAKTGGSTNSTVSMSFTSKYV
jgi:hypothetical protein